jgi:hypothetical protein
LNLGQVQKVMQVNYIQHMNAWYTKIQADDRLNPSHISLYIALFQMWNINRFQNPISISRDETMRVSKIGSRTTYLKCLKELSAWEYIEYFPSQNPFKGSLVHITIFWTSTEQVVGQEQTKNWTSTGQVLGSSINSIKQYKPNIKKKEILKDKKFDEPL